MPAPERLLQGEVRKAPQAWGRPHPLMDKRTSEHYSPRGHDLLSTRPCSGPCGQHDS